MKLLETTFADDKHTLVLLIPFYSPDMSLWFQLNPGWKSAFKSYQEVFEADADSSEFKRYVTVLSELSEKVIETVDCYVTSYLAE